MCVCLAHSVSHFNSSTATFSESMFPSSLSPDFKTSAACIQHFYPCASLSPTRITLTMKDLKVGANSSLKEKNPRPLDPKKRLLVPALTLFYTNKREGIKSIKKIRDQSFLFDIKTGSIKKVE